MKFILWIMILILSFAINRFVGFGAIVIFLIYFAFMKRYLIYVQRANVAFNSGDAGKALTLYKKAYDTGRASNSQILKYAILQLRSGNPEEAVKLFNIIMSSSEKKANVRNQAKQYRALAYFKLGQFEDAKEEADEIFEEYKNTVSYGLICYIKLATKEPINEVLPICLEAYEYNSDDRDIVDNLAYAYILNGEYEKAKKMTDELIEKFPTFVEAYYHGALAYKNLGDFDSAGKLLDEIDIKCKRTYLTTVSQEEIEYLKDNLK